MSRKERQDYGKGEATRNTEKECQEVGELSFIKQLCAKGRRRKFGNVGPSE